MNAGMFGTYSYILITYESWPGYWRFSVAVYVLYSDTENIRPFTVESFLCTSQPHLYQRHLKEQLRTIREVRSMPNGQYRVSDAYCFIYTRVYIVADNPVR